MGRKNKNNRLTNKMKTKHTLLFVIIYIAVLGPLIRFLGNLALVNFGSVMASAKYGQLLSIPMWFIPLVLTLTIEKGGVKIAAFILSGLYILYRLGTSIYYLIKFSSYLN